MILLSMLFFMWGFITALNDVLAPHMRSAFDLNFKQQQLVQFAFFIAYFVGSAAYYLYSLYKGDLLSRIGYQRGIVIGLGISATGALLFVPASTLYSYPLFLAGLFLIGLGFTLLQISANPYVSELGSEETASRRLNQAQGFNSFGTVFAPLFGGFLIYRIFSATEGHEAERLMGPYLIFAIALLTLAVVFYFISLPRIQTQSNVQGGLAIFKFPQLSFGMIAIFLYVGAEVSVGSLLSDYLCLPEVGGICKETFLNAEGVRETTDPANDYLGLYWGGLMIGRFLGGLVFVKGGLKNSRLPLMLGIAAACGLLIYGGIYLRSPQVGLSELWIWGLMILVQILLFYLGRGRPALTLTLFSICAMVLLATGGLGHGKLAMWAVISVGLFNSIMWSNIFTMAIGGLGELKSQASSLLIMMILGGALYPLLQGSFADIPSIGLKGSFLVPGIAYFYLAFYGLLINKRSAGTI